MPMLRNLIEEIGTTRSLVEDLEDKNKNLANIKIEIDNWYAMGVWTLDYQS